MKQLSIYLLTYLLLCSSFSVFADTNSITQADQLWQHNRTQGMTEKAIAILETVIEKEPDNFEALWKLSQYYQFLGTVSKPKERVVIYEKGLDYAERAKKINEKDVNGYLWHAILVGSISQENSNSKSLKPVNQMYDDLQIALKIDPKNSTAHLVLAQLLNAVPGKPVSFGDKKKALEEAGFAVQYGPEDGGAWIYYGWLLLENKDYAAAKNAYAKFLDLTGDYNQYNYLIEHEDKINEDYESCWRLGYFYEFLGQNCPDKKMRLNFFELGRKFTERAIKLNPNGVDGHLYQAILMGDIGLEKGILKSLAMVKPMSEELQTVIGLDPKNATAHYVLGQLYWKVPGKPLSIGDKKKAQEETALAVKYNPQSEEFWFDYGKIALDNKDFNTARIAFKRVVGIFGDYGYYKIEAQRELDKLPKE